jgi:hypothetical protein
MLRRRWVADGRTAGDGVHWKILLYVSQRLGVPRANSCDRFPICYTILVLPTSVNRWIGFVASTRQSEADRNAGIPATPPFASFMCGAIYQLTPFVNVILLFLKGGTRLVSLELETTDEMGEPSLDTHTPRVRAQVNQAPYQTEPFAMPIELRERSSWLASGDEKEGSVGTSRLNPSSLR